MLDLDGVNFGQFVIGIGSFVNILELDKVTLEKFGLLITIFGFDIWSPDQNHGLRRGTFWANFVV